MTRVLVIGNSHIGAIRAAQDRIVSAWPALEVTCFGVPGARFSAARVDAKGVFRPDAEDEKARAQAVQINGRAEVNLSRFDAVFVIGARFRLMRALRLATGCDVVGWPERREETPLVSNALLTDALHELAQEGAREIADQFGGRSALTVAAAAFPATEVTQPGPHHDRLFSAVAACPDRGRIYRIYQSAIAAALKAVGIRYIPQPEETLFAPFLTRNEYALNAVDFRHEDRPLSDKRHMNADYGYSLFQAYARSLPAQSEMTT